MALHSSLTAGQLTRCGASRGTTELIRSGGRKAAPHNRNSLYAFVLLLRLGDHTLPGIASVAGRQLDLGAAEVVARRAREPATAPRYETNAFENHEAGL